MALYSTWATKLSALPATSSGLGLFLGTDVLGLVSDLKNAAEGSRDVPISPVECLCARGSFTIMWVDVELDVDPVVGRRCELWVVGRGAGVWREERTRRGEEGGVSHIRPVELRVLPSGVIPATAMT